MLALKSNKIDSASLLIERGAAVNVVSSKGVTPLHAAVLAQNETEVKLLIEKGAKLMPSKELECGRYLFVILLFVLMVAIQCSSLCCFRTRYKIGRTSYRKRTTTS